MKAETEDGTKIVCTKQLDSAVRRMLLHASVVFFSSHKWVIVQSCMIALDFLRAQIGTNIKRIRQRIWIEVTLSAVK